MMGHRCKRAWMIRPKMRNAGMISRQGWDSAEMRRSRMRKIRMMDSDTITKLRMMGAWTMKHRMRIGSDAMTTRMMGVVRWNRMRMGTAD